MVHVTNLTPFEDILLKWSFIGPSTTTENHEVQVKNTFKNTKNYDPLMIPSILKTRHFS